MTVSMRRPTDHHGLLDAALEHAARGWHVFPLRPGDKRPAIARWEQRATTDPQRIERCWGDGVAYNVGVATGPSGLVVVDLDQPKPDAPAPDEWSLPGVNWGLDVLAVLAERHGEELPVCTHRVLTCSGGEHLYFAAPPGFELRNSARKLGHLIDTRARGGYIVAARSVIDGRRYEAADTAELAVLPAWLTALLTHTGRSDPARWEQALDAVARRSRYAAAALRGELDRVLDAPVGQRNHTLNTASFALGQLVATGLIPDTLATDALTHAARAAGLGEHETAATILSGITAGARHPRSRWDVPHDPTNTGRGHQRGTDPVPSRRPPHPRRPA
jgi:Bifunctional DNA primase/polymerase, N-terminal